MERVNKKMQGNLSMWIVLLLVFIPASLITTIYILTSYLLHDSIPTLLLFFLLVLFILLPIELWVVLLSSKKNYGKFSLKSAFINHEKLSWWKIAAYGSVLFAFAGLMSVTIAPLENMLFAPLSNQLTGMIPSYFDWYNIDYLKVYPKNILIITCIVYFIMNVIIGPIIEELFFRGYLTAKISRFGKGAPIIITVLFALYHFWLPFNNLFRIIAFYPAFYMAWKKKNIYISIVFHCLCNLISAIGFIVAVFAII